jgi:Acyl-coenzyme A:6-aminopenicillanic acid acyl-transferase
VTGSPRSAGGVPFVRVTAGPFGLGFAHGQARAGALREFIADNLCRISALAPSPVTAESLRPALAEYGAAITHAAPRLSEELDGLAAGAGIPRDMATLLQVRREIIGYQRIPARGDCTTYASLSAGPDGSPVLAQTVDLNGNLDDQITVLDAGLTSSGRRALILSFGGLLGYLGLNSDGLAIGLNLVLGGQWGPGLPPYLAIRHLLDHAGSVAEALEILRGLPLASSRTLMLCDSRGIVCAEILGNELRLIEPGPRRQHLTHTNHFLHANFTSHDELNVFARNSSLLRLKAAEAGLAELPAHGAGPEEHFALLTQTPICVAGTGDIRRERTVAAVVMLPAHGELHLRPGDPSQSETETFRFAP